MATSFKGKSTSGTQPQISPGRTTEPLIYGSISPGAVILMPPSHPKKKSVIEVYLLALFFGYLGAHHFYLRRPCFGILYLFSLGLFGVGYVVDLFRIPCLVNDENRRANNPALENKKSVFDAYLMWFPFGLLGFHHFYLRRVGWGILYLCTGGLLGIGWIIDAFRIPYLVKHADAEQPEGPETKNLCLAYICAFPPFGLLGGHHLYLNRPMWALIYFVTLGFFGIGWIVDLFRMPTLVKRTNMELRGERELKIYLDDAYILWLLPGGISGAHHFYLRRFGWGLLYFLTYGIFGVGWLIDLFRLPSLVREHNEMLKARCGLVVVRDQHGDQRRPNGNSIMTNATFTGSESGHYQAAGHPVIQPSGQSYPNAPNQQHLPGYPPQYQDGYMHPNVYPPSAHYREEEPPPPYTATVDEVVKR